MISLKLIQRSNRPLMILSAALLLQTAGSLTAAHAGDAQAQARELLSQTAAVQPNALPSNTFRAAGISPAVALDAQGQARQILLDTKPTWAVGIVARGRVSTHADAQEMAQRVILGMSNRSNLPDGEI